jgi:peptidoglycan/LPS O-acetylase OafA/YrhL
VFFFHYGMSAHTNTLPVQLLTHVTSAGWVGVDMFFVLSGFLITGILLDTREQPHYFRNFYVRRALRIFPLFYGVFLLLAALTPLLHLQWRPGHILQLFYLGNFAGHYDPSLNDLLPAVLLVHLWSLAVEEQFYMVWPFVVLWAPNRKTLLRICCAAPVLAFLLRCLLLWKFPERAQEWSYGELPTHIDGLVCGAIAAILTRSFDLTLLVRKSRMPFAFSGIALTMLAIYNHGIVYHNTAMTLLGYPLLGIFFTCALLRTIQPRSLLSRLGQTRFLRFFGKYSYGMYIFHNLFNPLVSKLLRPLQSLTHSQSIGGVLFVLVVLALTCIVSVLSFELYEKQWLKLKSRFSYREPKLVHQPAS